MLVSDTNTLNSIHKVLKNIPNIITLSRLILSFVFIYLFTQSKDFFLEALIVFGIAAFTDYLDGFLARKLNTVSKFGEQLDPFCDKVLTLSAFFAFAVNGIIPMWCVIIVATRDVANTIIRYIFLSKKNIPTSKSAKLKTVLQFIFILLILFLQAFSNDGTDRTVNTIVHSIYIDCAMIGITLITVWTMIEYILQLKKSN